MRPRFVWRLAAALSAWLAMALLHRRVSDLVGEALPTPWGPITPINHVTTAAILVGIALLAGLLWRSRAAAGAVLGTWALWGGLVAVTGVCQWLLATIAIEAIHYPQYALVAGLLAWALDPTRRRRRVLEVVLICAGLSLADEALQYLHLMQRARYFDFNDLVFNQLGVLAGLLWYYGFPGPPRPAVAEPRLLFALLVATAAGAVVCAGLGAAGWLVLTPTEPITQDGVWRLRGGPRIVLQWSAGTYDKMQASRSGGRYFVMGPRLWLAFMVATSLAAWALQRRLGAGLGVGGAGRAAPVAGVAKARRERSL